MVTSLSIEGIRGILHGELASLAPVTVLVGPNGAGKSTILDALLIGASPDPCEGLAAAVARRLEPQDEPRWFFWRGASDAVGRIKVVDRTEVSCTITLVRDTGDDYAWKLDLLGPTVPSGRTEGQVVLRRSQGWQLVSSTKPALKRQAPILMVDSRGARPVAPLHQVYSRMVEQGRQGEAHQFVAELVAGAKQIEILSPVSIPVVYVVFDGFSLPVQSLSDGCRAALRLGMSLLNCSKGLALLEEPELHQHPKSLSQVAKAILVAARRGVQVVISTHSMEFIDSLVGQATSAADLDGIAVVRVALSEGELRSTRIPGPEVARRRASIEEDLR